MQYAEISEAWNNSLNSKIKEVEANQRAFSNQSLHNLRLEKPFVEDNNDNVMLNSGSLLDSSLLLDVNGSIPISSNNVSYNNAQRNPNMITPTSYSSEPIRSYTQDNSNNIPNKKPCMSQKVQYPSGGHIEAYDEIDDNFNNYESITSSREYPVSHQKRSKNIKKYKNNESESESDNDFYYRKKDKRKNKCEKMHKHIKNCKHCYNTYKSDDSFTISLNYKNTLLIFLLSITIIFILYYMFKK